MMKLKSRKGSRKGYLFYLIVFFLIIYILFLDEASFIQKLKYKFKLKRLQSDIETMEKDNERLSGENKDLKENPKTWEKHARDMGMQKEDEETFIFKEDEK